MKYIGARVALTHFPSLCSNGDMYFSGRLSIINWGPANFLILQSGNNFSLCPQILHAYIGNLSAN